MIEQQKKPGGSSTSFRRKGVTFDVGTAMLYGFGSHIEELIAGIPTTIERYPLKNWGAVGGPKHMIGQQVLRRLHARSEWKKLYVCGDSTVMVTGAPATVVSGVGAANMVLRDLHKPEYDLQVSAAVRGIQDPIPAAQLRRGRPDYEQECRAGRRVAVDIYVWQ